jgi:hypothetical protein
MKMQSQICEADSDLDFCSKNLNCTAYFRLKSKNLNTNRFGYARFRAVNGDNSSFEKNAYKISPTPFLDVSVLSELRKQAMSGTTL